MWDTFPQHWGNSPGLKNVISPVLGKSPSAGSPYIVYWIIRLDQKLLGQKIFRPKIFRSQHFLNPNLFSTKIYLDQFLLILHFSGPKFCYHEKWFYSFNQNRFWMQHGLECTREWSYLCFAQLVTFKFLPVIFNFSLFCNKSW